jgi:hypothetical protein
MFFITGGKMEERTQLIRYSPPTRYDIAPFGTICKVIDDGNTPKYFIQFNKEPDTARWESMSYLLENVFNDYITNTEFIDACLKAYNDKSKDSLIKISDILKY